MRRELFIMIAGIGVSVALFLVVPGHFLPVSFGQAEGSETISSTQSIAEVSEFTPTPSVKDLTFIKAEVQPDVWPLRDWNVANPTLRASSSYVVLPEQDKALFEFASHDRLPPASITKLLTALTALERADAETVIEITQEAIDEDGVSQLAVGDHLTLAQLILHMFLPSSNDGARAMWIQLGREDFTNAMNQKARELGMKESHFINPTGLHEEGHYSSAHDIALLLGAVLNNEFLVHTMGLKTISMTTLEGRSMMLTNSDKLLGHVPNLLGGKTGFTYEARQTFAVATEEAPNPSSYLAREPRSAAGAGEPTIVIYVILGSDDRDADMTKLINWTRAAYKF